MNKKIQKSIYIKQKVQVYKRSGALQESKCRGQAICVSVNQVYKILKSKGVRSKNHQDPTFRKDSKLMYV